MEQKLTEWLTRHAQKNNSILKGVQNKEIDTAIVLPGDQVLSLARLSGDNKENLLRKDAEMDSLFKKSGAKDYAFIQMLQANPVTGMAVLMYACQSRAGFLPRQGENSLAEFNQFIENSVECPLISIDKNKSFSSTAEFTSKDETMPNSITENFIFDDESESNQALLDQIQKCLTKMGNNSYKIDIYNMEIHGDENACLSVRAGTIAVTCTAGKLNYKFSALAKGFNVDLAMSGINWSNSAAQIIDSIPFITIEQWIEANNLS